METPSLIYLVLDTHTDEFKTCDPRITNAALLFGLGELETVLCFPQNRFGVKHFTPRAAQTKLNKRSSVFFCSIVALFCFSLNRLRAQKSTRDFGNSQESEHERDSYKFRHILCERLKWNWKTNCGKILMEMTAWTQSSSWPVIKSFKLFFI